LGVRSLTNTNFMWRLLARNRFCGRIAAATVKRRGYGVEIYGRPLGEP
jgi:hypothetical protein